MRSPRPLLTALTLALIASSARADDVVRVPLEWGDGSIVGAAPQLVEVSFGLASRGRLPEGVVDPRRGRVPLAAAPGGGVSVLLDMAPGREHVWFDTDLDGDVDDERPASWQRNGLRWAVSSVVRVPADGGFVAVPVRLWRGAFRPDDEFLVEARVHRWGAASIAGALRLVAVEDVDGDLRFDPAGPDVVLIDIDGDGALDRTPGSPEIVALGGTVELSRVRWRVDVAADGSELRLERAASVTPEPAPGTPVAPPIASFEELFERLGNERRYPADERAGTLRSLGALGNTEALLVLERTAREDIDMDVRVLAAACLANPAFGAPGAERSLQLARTAPADVACAAVRSLHRIGGATLTDALAELVSDARPDVAREAARLLAGIDSSAARSALQLAVKQRPSALARLAVYEGVAAAGPVPEAVAVIGAEDVHTPLRARALSDLLDLRSPRAAALLQASVEDLAPRDDGTTWLPLLARSGDARSVDAIIQIGAERNRDAALAWATRLPDSPASSRLAKGLDAARAETRAFSAEALGLRGDTRVCGRLLSRLEDERSVAVRDALLTALGDLGDVRSVVALEHATSSEGGGGPAVFFAALSSPWMRDVDEVRSALRQGMREDVWRTREMAVGAAGVVGDAALLGIVRTLLRDDHRLVRAAAAEVLGEVRERDSVRPLIEALRDERSQSVREVIGRSLFRLTGANLYDALDLWVQWWTDHGATFEVPDEIPMLPPASIGGTSAPEPPRFYGIALETESVVFVIDQSGSMATGGNALFVPGEVAVNSKFGTAVRELLGAVDALDDGVEVNVILFESTVRSWRRAPDRLSEHTRKALRRYMEKQQPSGATNLFDAVERALRTPDIETIVVLSDGDPTHGKLVAPGEIRAAVQQMNERRGVVIHCVAIGGPSPLLRRIAADNDGEYVVR